MKHYTLSISQLFGKFASTHFPKPIQSVINNGYVKLMGLDMSEFDEPSAYESLNALFTRRLKRPRKFSDDPRDMISPCDAFISEAGTIESATAMQIKGMRYGVDELLGEFVDTSAKRLLEGGAYINFYLSPKDYHRYHIPIDCTIRQAIYIPGKLYPVNMPALRNIASLFVQNERVVLECEHNGKRFFMVMVGALNVGKMRIDFEPSIQTNANDMRSKAYRYEKMEMKKGEDFGCFEMGSTIVILSEKGLFDYNVAIGANVMFAQTIATAR